MIKAEVIKTVAKETGLSERRVSNVLDGFFKQIITGLKRDGKVQFNNFFVFYLHQRAPRMARNPKTGEPAPVLPKKVPRLRPADCFVDIFN